jgi:hypothetical protein
MNTVEDADTQRGAIARHVHRQQGIQLKRFSTAGGDGERHNRPKQKVTIAQGLNIASKLYNLKFIIYDDSTKWMF